MFFGNKYLLKGLIKKNPMLFFIYSVLSKFYLTIIAASIIVTYFVFKGLEKAGLIQYSEKTLAKAIVETKDVAKNCTPIIGKPKFIQMNCLVDCLCCEARSWSFVKSNIQDTTNINKTKRNK